MTKSQKGSSAQCSDRNMFEILFEKLEKLENKVETKECLSNLMTIINEQKKKLQICKKESPSLSSSKGDYVCALSVLIYR